jgi:hypothetical protein
LSLHWPVVRSCAYVAVPRAPLASPSPLLQLYVCADRAHAHRDHPVHVASQRKIAVSTPSSSPCTHPLPPSLIHFAPAHSPELRVSVLRARRSILVARPPAPESAPRLLRPRGVAGSGHSTRAERAAKEDDSPKKEDPPVSLTLPPLLSPRVAGDRWTLGPMRQRSAKPLPFALSRRLAGPARECATAAAPVLAPRR